MNHLPAPTVATRHSQAALASTQALGHSVHAQQQGPTLGSWLQATLTAARLADRGRAVDIDLHDPNCIVPSDSDATAQAVLMLIANACRYSAAGTRLRLTSRIQWVDGQDHLVISVCDRGIGMTRAFLQRAFDPIVVQAAGDAAQQTLELVREGGLRTARSLMEAQGGWIELRSASGIGTEADAWLALPVSADRQA
jgi:signal transduction histidine kinase